MSDIVSYQEKVIDELLDFLHPCLKRSKRPEWSTFRYYTAWGSKTDIGLKSCLQRIIFDPDHKPPTKGE